MSPLIDQNKFVEATSRQPIADDLERCNCARAGQNGHWNCGWCAKHDLPMFDCGCYASAKTMELGSKSIVRRISAQIATPFRQQHD